MSRRLVLELFLFEYMYNEELGKQNYFVIHGLKFLFLCFKLTIILGHAPTQRKMKFKPGISEPWHKKCKFLLHFSWMQIISNQSYKAQNAMHTLYMYMCML